MKSLTVIITIIFTIFSFTGCKKDKKTENKALKADLIKEVRVVKPKKISLPLVIKEGVTLSPEEKGAVSADLTATLVKWYVKEHQKVKRGQAIALLDSIDYKMQLEQQKAALAALEAQFAGVEKDYKRMNALLKNRSIPRQQFDSVETQYFAMQKQVEATKKGVGLMKRRVGKTTVRAPFSGVITKKLLSKGSKIIIAMPGSGDIAHIEKNDKLKVTINISEKYFSEIEEGMEIAYFIPSLDKTMKGKIASKGKSINAMKNFNIIAYIENKNNEIPSGSYATATLKTPEKERVIVPAMSVKNSESGRGTVFTVKDGVVNSSEVYIGHSFEEGIEIKGDFPEFIIKDASSIQQGEKVSYSFEEKVGE